jgi:hypothetical protein
MPEAGICPKCGRRIVVRLDPVSGRILLGPHNWKRLERCPGSRVEAIKGSISWQRPGLPTKLPD